MTSWLGELSSDTYAPHPIHGPNQVWAETNCYVDMWVEVLHTLGFDPVPAGACALSADFDGEQWQFLKFPAEDLRALYGIEVTEMNVWRPVHDHISSEIASGRMLTVEVDAWWLPDTAGTSYHRQHVKTTIAPQFIDVDIRRLRYFHGPGYFELSGDDFDGLFQLGSHAAVPSLPPYVELVRFDRCLPGNGMVERAATLARDHVARRPLDNPVSRMGGAIFGRLGWLSTQTLETFHLYAFGTLRQCGATAELAAGFVEWLTRHGAAQLTSAGSEYRAVAAAAKTAQFQLSRVVSGRTVDLTATLSSMSASWAAATADVVAWSNP